MDLRPFEKKVWLSSPTMHGEELKYITEAYETNWMSTVGENINEAENLICKKGRMSVFGSTFSRNSSFTYGGKISRCQTGRTCILF